MTALSKINIHKSIFALSIFLLIFVSAFEIHYLLYLALVLFYYAKISKKLLNIVLFFMAIMVVSSFSSIFNKSILYDWVKDFTYFSRPILAILAGYLISKKINNLISILRIIVFISLIFAIIHIFKIFYFIDLNTDSVNDIRRIGGISNEIEVFSIVILLASNRLNNFEIIPNTFYKKLALILLSVSFFLYFSRTMFVSFTILYLASLGYMKLTRKSIKYGILVLTLFGLFYAYLFSREFERGKPGLESFLYKMKIAPAEIFSPSKSIDTKNHANLWDHWRAYEAKMALNQMDTNLSFFIGNGFGSLVDLKFMAPLGESNMRYIPTLHNGYITILFKSGILGLIFYFLVLIILYLFCFNNHENEVKKMFFNLISGLSIHYLFTTLIVTGIYNNKEPFVLIVGFLLYFSLQKEKKITE